MFKITQKFLLLFLVVMLCVFAGNAGAEDCPDLYEINWEVITSLECKDWEVDTPDALMDVGDVMIGETGENLAIRIEPCSVCPYNKDNYRVSKIAIDIALDPKDFYHIFDDKKGKIRPKLFDYQTNYLKDPGEPQEYFCQEILFADIRDRFCNSDECPTELYIVVYAVLQYFDGDEWKDLPEKAMARDAIIEDGEEVDGSDLIGGWYVTYPLANSE